MNRKNKKKARLLKELTPEQINKQIDNLIKEVDNDISDLYIMEIIRLIPACLFVLLMIIFKLSPWFAIIPCYLLASAIVKDLFRHKSISDRKTLIVIKEKNNKIRKDK
jgi:hypothetical protein